MLGDTLIANDYPESSPLEDTRSRVNVARYRGLCEIHSCMASAEVMAKELDRALAAPVSHEPGALVACSAK